jgi:L-amino acid N-acyltransferase YncA
MTLIDAGEIALREATADDAQVIADIYNHFIQHTVISFEEEVISATEIQRRMTELQRAGLPWLVVERNNAVLGYAYAAPWRTRSAYRFSVETTIYLAPGQEGRGLGRVLYEALLPKLKERGVHAAIGGITLPNAASVGLHERCGFVKVAEFPEVGFKFGRWLTVGYWQRQL